MHANEGQNHSSNERPTNEHDDSVELLSARRVLRLHGQQSRPLQGHLKVLLKLAGQYNFARSHPNL